MCPCKDCETRFVGCHGNCESYILWKLEKNKVRDEQRKSKELDIFLETQYIRHNW